MREGIEYTEDVNDHNEIDSLLMAKMISTGKRVGGKLIGPSIIDNAISSIIRSIRKKTKMHFGFEFNISMSMDGIEQVQNINKWILEYSNNARKKMSNDDELIKNSSFFIKIDSHTYAVVKIGSELRSMLSNDLGDIFLKKNRIEDYDVYLYIFGKNSYKEKLLIDMIMKNRSDILRMYKISGDASKSGDIAFRSLFQDLENRELSTVFFENGTVDKITSHIDNYLANRELYTGRGIIYKTGILLHGEPGTGKTSLIKAIANKYNMDLINIDMGTFDKLGLESMVHSINIDDRRYIISLEDIDCVIADRDNANIDKDEKRIVNKLLQLLDSNSSPKEVIFIATTNHIELLDEALLREGRFDLQIKIEGLKENKAKEMCRSFDLSDSQIDQIIDNIKKGGNDLINNTIRQSKLQTLILKQSGLNIRGEVCEEDEQD